MKKYIFGIVQIFLGLIVAGYASYAVGSKDYIDSSFGGLTNIFMNLSYALFITALTIILQGIINIKKKD